MAPFIARKSIGKTAALVIGCIVFVMGGIVLIGVFGDSLAAREPTWWTRTVGWVTTLFFGLCAITHMRNLLGPDEQLRVDRSGILWRPWSGRPVPWNEIIEIDISVAGRSRDIVLKLRNPEKYHSSRISRFIANGGRTLRKNSVHVTLLGTNRSFDDAISAINFFRP